MLRKWLRRWRLWPMQDGGLGCLTNDDIDALPEQPAKTRSRT